MLQLLVVWLWVSCVCSLLRYNVVGLRWEIRPEALHSVVVRVAGPIAAPPRWCTVRALVCCVRASRRDGSPSGRVAAGRSRAPTRVCVFRASRL